MSLGVVDRRRQAPRPWSRGREMPVGVLAGAGMLGYTAVLTGTYLLVPDRPTVVAAAVPVSILLVWAGLRSPLVAAGYLLCATFFRLALPRVLPVDLFVAAFLILVGAAVLWSWRRSRWPALDAVTVAMAAYIGWNLVSMRAGHPFAAGSLLDVDADFSVPRFILTGAVMPFAAFLIGRHVLADRRSATAVLWLVAMFAAYSALMAILQFHGPAALVWPRYIIDLPYWPGRAVGVFAQPVVNGLVLIFGFVCAIALAGDRAAATPRRVVAGVVTAACAYGIVLTHTRAVWMAFALVLVLGMVCARGRRLGYAIPATVLIAVVATNWAAFTSADRSAGGVGSTNEVEDRLNAVATSLWAIEQKPWAGWGIGRFTGVNTVHHRQFSPEVPWFRGYGISSHLNELGIFVELGLIGLALWAAVVVSVVVLWNRSRRMLRGPELTAAPMVAAAGLMLAAQLVTGVTVDLRFFDFPTIVTLLTVGIVVGLADRAGPRSASVTGAVDRRRR